MLVTPHLAAGCSYETQKGYGHIFTI